MQENDLTDSYEDSVPTNKSKSFRFRFALIFITIETLFLLGIMMFNSNALQKESDQLIEEKTSLATSLLWEMLVTPLVQGDMALANEMAERFVNKKGLVKFELIDSLGQKIIAVHNKSLAKPHNKPDPIFAQHFQQHKSGRIGQVFEINGVSYITVKDQLSISGQKIGSARLIYDVSRSVSAIESMQFGNLVLTWVCVVISTIVALVIGFHIARSLEEMSDIAAIIAHHRDMAMPAYNPKGDEIDQLYHSIHLMQQSIRRRETALTLERERALEASEAKSDFLAVMSHEIRTPINGITGALSLLDKTKLSSDDVEQINIAQTSSELLLTVINDILDYSKIEAGKFKVDPVPVSINNLVNDIETVYRPLIEDKGLEFEVDSKSIKKIYARADEIRIRQILSNYLNNAVKFTSEGQIKLLVTMSKPDVLQFTVSDSGIGIKPEDMSKLFKDFSQVDKGISRKFGGTGLGLVITKKLAGLMNGRVHAESVPGVGSKFSVYLKLDFIEEATYLKLTGNKPANKQAIPTEINARILLVEDNLINQKVASRILEKAGCQVHIVNNGLEAVQHLEKNDEYDVVLMDCQMPVMDGLTATREIRKLGKTIPVIALTASALESDRQSCIDAGMNDFVTKPFEASKLCATITHHRQENLARAA